MSNNESLEPEDLADLIRRKQFVTILKKICPAHIGYPSCQAKYIHEFQQLNEQNQEVSKKLLSPDRNHHHMFFGDAFLAKIYLASEDLELDHALHEINTGLRVKDSIRVNNVDNMVPLLSCCEDSVRSLAGKIIPQFWLQFKRYPLGSLSDFMKNEANEALFNSVTWKFVIVEGIINGLHAFHERNYIHRDLKANNILMKDPWTPMLGDFGFSKKFDGTQDTIGGTEIFMAPEMKKEQPYSLKLDIWNAGALIYYVTVPKSFKWTHDWVSVARKTCDGLTVSKLKMNDDVFVYCKYFNKMVLSMLNEDPAQRPDIAEVSVEFRTQLERIIQHQNLIYGNFAQQLRENKLPAGHRFWGVLKNAYEQTQMTFKQLTGKPLDALQHIRSIHPGWFNEKGDLLDDERAKWADIYYEFITSNPQTPELGPSQLVRI